MRTPGMLGPAWLIAQGAETSEGSVYDLMVLVGWSGERYECVHLPVLNEDDPRAKHDVWLRQYRAVPGPERGRLLFARALEVPDLKLYSRGEPGIPFEPCHVSRSPQLKAWVARLNAQSGIHSP